MFVDVRFCLRAWMSDPKLALIPLDTTMGVDSVEFAKVEGTEEMDIRERGGEIRVRSVVNKIYVR